MSEGWMDGVSALIPATAHRGAQQGSLAWGSVNGAVTRVRKAAPISHWDMPRAAKEAG